jgi:CRP/FNR family transcriptional regulator, anaerobic regulatory protein
MSMPKAAINPPGSSDVNRLLKPSIRTHPFETADLLGVKRLTARDREHLALISTRLRVRAGMTIFERGTPATAVFNIIEGAAASFRPLENGGRRVLAFLFAEDLSGLARGGRYVNTVVALTPVTVFRIPLEELKTMLLRNPELQLHFLCKVTHALRESQRQAIVIGARDPVARVARFVTMMEEAQGPHEPGRVRLPMTRRDIGDYLNLKPQVVSDAFGELEKRRHIAIDAHGVRITDRRSLLGVAGEL